VVQLDRDVDPFAAQVVRTNPCDCYDFEFSASFGTNTVAHTRNRGELGEPSLAFELVEIGVTDSFDHGLSLTASVEYSSTTEK
jgi:hypothetical protein